MADVALPLRDEDEERRSAAPGGRFSTGPGRRETVARVADLIVRRGQGRFFISGYSGVGKSSFIAHVTDEIRLRLAARDADRRFVFRIDLTGYRLDDVAIIGRQLMLQLNWEIERSGLNLGRVARQRLVRAVEGVTARSVERLQARTEDVSPKLEVKTPIADLGLGGTRQDRAEKRSVFEGFDIPTTLLELGNLIREIPRSVASAAPQGWARFISGARRMPKPLVVVTIDRIGSWEVIPKLADLFNSPGVAFLVVVPLSVRRQWLEGREGGREDVPGFQDIYLPCVWDDIEDIVKSVIDLKALPPDRRSVLRKLAAYLAFQSAGIPKRCEELLFNHIQVRPHGRFLRLGSRDLADIEFCAELYELVRRRERDLLGGLFEGLTTADRDRYRRVLITTLRELVSKGSLDIAMGGGGGQTVMLALETVTPDERTQILQRVVRVLEEENLATRMGTTVTLSRSARDKVAQGHTILMRALLPDLPPAPALDTGPMAPVAPRPSPLPPPVSKPAPGAPPPPAEPPPEPSHTVRLSAPDRPAVVTSANLFEGEVGRALREATQGVYDIEAMVGKGGMSVVYRARERALNRVVAIKVLPPSLTVDAATMERFRQEARISAGLTHPNIVPIYRISDPGPLVWYAMMYLAGPNLRGLIDAAAPVGVARVVESVRPIARALDHAHREGVVHRDIKPENIVMGPGGEYLLTDFGIAKALEAPEDLTGTGMAIGTPRYMAPEQALAQPPSGATDQYSLAVVCFELLTGMLPFVGDAFSILRQHVESIPPLASSANPSIPIGAATVVARALAKKPDARFPSVGDFLAALAEAGETKSRGA